MLIIFCIFSKLAAKCELILKLKINKPAQNLIVEKFSPAFFKRRII